MVSGLSGSGASQSPVAGAARHDVRVTGTIGSVFVMAILVAGYVAVFALWWFVFRKGGE
jgi:hypothetical protein